MKKNLPPLVKKLISCALVLYLTVGFLAVKPARSQSLPGGLTQTTQNVLQVVKISSDLLDLVLQGKIGERANVVVQSNGSWSFM